eukprot:gb/GFBE01031894.1/.p1 GENE.gb/GFBE01031894.1/~~gb/GFBE01031894.1/.p1  ORF type:complete len:284 (+),score=18.54 gb/GFBE01031894.1/:1-852(+)
MSTDGEPKEHGTHRLLNAISFVRVTSSPHYNFACTLALALVITAGITETLDPTAYGKFGLEANWTLPPRLGWWCMEFPVTVSFLYFYFVQGGPQSHELVPRICAAIFCMHYCYRGWIYPYLLRPHPGAQSNFSLLPALGGWLVTVTHGYLNARWFAEHGKHLRRSWHRHPCFVLGLILYLTGFVALVYHDNIMRDLRPCPGGERYCIPRGGLFEYATQAVYFCELWAWLGFLLMSCGPNGAFIFLVSLANLVPRSISSHEWYLRKFGEDYASLNRRYLVPFVW